MLFIDGDEVKKVEKFKCLGRQISSRDYDFPALFFKLSKAKKLYLYLIVTHKRQDFPVR